MNSVGLAMIVRECAETLDVCLQSVAGIFDDLVIVDTGSTDDTIAVAEKHGARIFQFDWVDDFAAARNFSFDQLTTEYAFWLDGDDLLIGREHFDEMVEKCTAKSLDGIVLEYLYALDAVGAEFLKMAEPLILSGQADSQSVISQLRPRCTTTQHRERLVLNRPDMRWRYPVHEAIPVIGKRLGKYEKVKVIHRRHVRTRAVSADRNLKILLNVPMDRRDERGWFYLGLEHAHHQETDPAIEAFLRYLPLSTVDDEKYLVHHWLGDLYRVKADYERSISHDLQAVSMRPTWRDAYGGLLRTYTHLEDWPHVIYYGAMAKRSEIPDTPYAYNPLHEEVGWVGDYIQGLDHFGKYEDALEEVERARDLIPEDPNHIYNAGMLSGLINLKLGKQILANAVEFFLRYDDVETAALVLARLHPDLRDNPDMQRWIALTGTLCGQAARGEIAEDQLKVPPGMDQPKLEFEPDRSIRVHSNIPWEDLRVQYLTEQLAKRPEIREVLQIGGPSALSHVYAELGFRAGRTKGTDRFPDHQFDAVMLWSCLERVKSPDMLVEQARSHVRPGGYLMGCVPNGPSSKGLAPPRLEHLRLRAYDMDTFRKAMGTVRMPHVLPGGETDSGDLFLTIPIPQTEILRKEIAIVCPMAPEVWGPFSLAQGIGGSEEAVIRLSRAFTRRGHKVTVYGSGFIGQDIIPDVPIRIDYKSITEYHRADVLIGWRYPEIFLNQVRPLEAEWKALWLHDSIQRDRVAAVASSLDAVWCISDYHASLYDGIPGIYRGRNGIDPWEFNVEVVRDPAKCVYVSTPFRGLDILLERHWPKIRAQVPEATLHAYYGWDSADRMGATSTEDGRAFKEKVMRLAEQPGVVWHGRVGQPELYRELLSAGAWLYPTSWREENCISAYLAQAAGAWPVVYPLGALLQSVVFGWRVDDAHFVDAAVEAIGTEAGRDQMMQWVRKWVTWDDAAELWERLFIGREA